MGSEKRNTMIKLPESSNCYNCKESPAAFNLLDEDALKKLNENRLIVQYKPGETIFKQNSRATQALIVRSGFVKIFVEAPDNHILVYKYGKTGDFIGVSGMFTDSVYSFSVSAVEHCMVCFIDFEIISDFIDNVPGFGREIINLLSKEKAAMHSKFLCLTQKQVPGRVANALLYLNNEVYQNENKVIAGRTEIAELTGMTKDSAGRVLKEFMDENLITYSGKIISLKDIAKLEQIRDLG